jgi:hypothetical protein
VFDEVYILFNFNMILKHNGMFSAKVIYLALFFNWDARAEKVIIFIATRSSFLSAFNKKKSGAFHQF